MNRLTITAPDTSGTLYFDQTMMAVPVDNRWPTADIQQPFVNPDVVNMASKNWTALLMYDQMLRAEQPSFNYDLTFDDSHGKAPSNGEYEYAIKIAAQDALKPVYSVLQKDTKLHAIKGEWQLNGPNDQVTLTQTAGNTQIRVTTTDAKPEQFELRRK
ncbi:hypothetical protein OH461_12390 [Vibrio sp. LaRot3]|nr:hypothetical protein [Vibrio sp. LaRot3]MDA0149189.1 hypothetical protein [Vibrio sp. LaRot3]